MIDGFMDKFLSFIKNWEDQVRPEHERVVPNLEMVPLTYTKGKRFMRVVYDNSVVAFVDFNDGSIYKPAGWKAPAKHVRGNIFSNRNGMEAVSDGWIYSIRYLR